MPPLRLQPIIKQRPWGGERLARWWNKRDAGCAGWGESWEAVDLKADQSHVFGGPFADVSLSELIRDHRSSLLGTNSQATTFPLLVKFLDTSQTLSVQVHPTDEQAERLVPGQRGKSEAWLILAADPGSQLLIGLRAGVDRSILEAHVAGGTVAECLRVWPARVGDVFFIPAGTLHAIGAGISLAEIQQPSDVTFRLFDWNRADSEGQLRPLQVDAALQCIDFRATTLGPIKPKTLTLAELGETTESAEPTVLHDELIRTPEFTWRRHRSEGRPFSIRSEGRCHVLTVIAGAATIDHAEGSMSLAAGQTLLLPADCESIRVSPAPNCELLDAFV